MGADTWEYAPAPVVALVLDSSSSDEQYSSKEVRLAASSDAKQAH